MNKVGSVVAGVVILWFVFGNPLETVAGWFWTENPAPWEQVNAFYYPDRGNLTIDRRELNIGTLEACRDWVNAQAIADGDSSQTRSDYECGVGCKSEGEMLVCRLTVR